MHGYIYKKHSSSRHWSFYNSQGATESMAKQFVCHIYKANIIKTPWNLEPSKRPEEIGFNCNDPRSLFELLMSAIREID